MKDFLAEHLGNNFWNRHYNFWFPVHIHWHRALYLNVLPEAKQHETSIKPRKNQTRKYTVIEQLKTGRVYLVLREFNYALFRSRRILLLFVSYYRWRCCQCLAAPVLDLFYHGSAVLPLSTNVRRIFWYIHCVRFKVALIADRWP